MRVTIEHREESTGLTKSHKDCFVDCKVEFSEEERAIIKARDLYGESFIIRTSTPLPTGSNILGTTAMRLLGPLLIVGSIIAGIAGVGEGPSGFMFVGGIALTIYGWLRSRRIDRRLDSSDQQVTIKQLLSKPSFTVHAFSAGYAKGIEEEIRENLVSLKTLIQNSAELQSRQTFEL